MGRRMAVRVVAQDPSLRDSDDRIVTTVVGIPEEILAEGPRGHRVAVVDYDSTRRVHYEPWRYEPGSDLDRELSNEDILGQPWFHAQNAFALVMRTMVRFERALGRRAGWAFGGRPLHIAPHAFEEANAYYSPGDSALLFGYYPGVAGGQVHTSLSHDIVVHETTHALLDGTRRRYLDLAHPDQAAFHEGFADTVALLSAFTMTDTVQRVLLSLEHHVDRERRLLDRAGIDVEGMGMRVLLGMADQFGEPWSEVRGCPLRRSIDLITRRVDAADPGFAQPHRRGELLAAAVMGTFMGAWFERLTRAGDGAVSIDRATEDANDIAEALLDVTIKALDYAPPIDLVFGDYLSAMLTSDTEMRPDDSAYRLRAHALLWFARLGIQPTSDVEGGLWRQPRAGLRYDDSPIESIQRSPDEVLRFLWQNRRELRLEEDAHTHVLSVRPSVRIAGDGSFARETVVEYSQTLYTTPAECGARLRLPRRLAAETILKLSGGGMLTFDDLGTLKYHVYQRLLSDGQAERIRVLWDLGLLDAGGRSVPLSLAALHARRSAQAPQHY